MEIEPLPSQADPPAAPRNDIKPTAAAAPARLTVNDVLCLQPAGRGIEAQPSGVESRFERWLRSDQQLYERKAKVGPDWKPLPLPGPDWIDPADCGMLVLQNLERADGSVIPTPEQAAEVAGRVILVGLKEGDRPPQVFARVNPGESMRLHPVNVFEYVLSCPAGAARYSLTLVPG